jgi:hypothetical protein
MSRSVFAVVFIVAGLAWTAFDGSPVRAGGQDTPAGATPSRDDSESPTRRIDQALLAYEGRVDHELEQTRKDIARLQKELTEMVELQFGLAISLAEIQAEMRVQQSAAATQADSSTGSSASNSSASNREDERRRLRAVEMNRELRAVLDGLRGVVAQRRSETDQLALQLRSLRAQLRNLQEGKPAVKPSQD